MNTKFCIAALATAALAVSSCSSDETVDVQRGAAIGFNVTAGKASRAEASTTANLSAFKLYAKSSNNSAWFMNGLEVRKSGSTWDFADGGKRYWPAGATVDFLAYAPTGVAVNASTPGQLSIDNYVIDPKADVDLLYAYNKGYDRNSKGGEVDINFRHALAMLEFNVANTNPDLEIEIVELTLSGLNNTSTLSWATASTNHPDYSSAVGGSNDTERDNSWGKWASPTVTQTDNYSGDIGNFYLRATTSVSGEPTMAKTTMSGATGVTALVANKDLKNAFFVMPQTVKPWDKVGINNREPNHAEGSMIMILCKIKEKNAGFELWPMYNDGATQNGYQYVAVPFTGGADGKLKQGKRYVYTLTFGDGAGYNPWSGVPILGKVGLDVTVQEYAIGTDSTTEILP